MRKKKVRDGKMDPQRERDRGRVSGDRRGWLVLSGQQGRQVGGWRILCAVSIPGGKAAEENVEGLI